VAIWYKLVYFGKLCPEKSGSPAGEASGVRSDNESAGSTNLKLTFMPALKKRFWTEFFLSNEDDIFLVKSFENNFLSFSLKNKKMHFKSVSQHSITIFA
jgi:hypothetical protein